MRKIITILLCLGVIFAFQLWQGDLANAKDKLFRCNLAGTWTMELDGGAMPPYITTFIPLDRKGRTFANIDELPEPKVPNWPGQGASSTNFNGRTVRVGRNLFKTSYYAFGLDESWNKVWEVEGSGMIKFLDCDHIVSVGNNTVLLNGGFGFCAPYTLRGERLEMFEPCGDLPPFPEFE